MANKSCWWKAAFVGFGIAGGLLLSGAACLEGFRQAGDFLNEKIAKPIDHAEKNIIALVR